MEWHRFACLKQKAKHKAQLFVKALQQGYVDSRRMPLQKDGDWKSRSMWKRRRKITHRWHVEIMYIWINNLLNYFSKVSVLHLVAQSQAFSNCVYQRTEVIGDKCRVIMNTNPQAPDSVWQERNATWLPPNCEMLHWSCCVFLGIYAIQFYFLSW